MLLELSNTPRDYAWGSLTGIADFLGAEPGGGPEAELWFGAHPGSPTRTPRAVPDPGQEHETLADWIDARPDLLGAVGEKLPILLKVLAARTPLSLQVHPTPEQAAAGFADEEARGVARDDPARNYKDPSAKPEIIVAVSERFEALCGFRPAAEVAEVVAALADADAAVAPLRDILSDPTAVSAALSWLLSGEPEVAACVAAVTAFAQSPEAVRPPQAATFRTVRELAAHYPGDPGVLIAMLMNRVSLRRGEGLYARAGLLHAYVSGVGIELMTASDNVVRCGLTPKHVDPTELRRLLSFDQGEPVLLQASEVDAGVMRYAPPAPFELTVVRPGREGLDVALSGPSIVLVEREPLTISAGDDVLELPQGGAAFADASTRELHVAGPGRLWIATALAD